MQIHDIIHHELMSKGHCNANKKCTSFILSRNCLYGVGGLPTKEVSPSVCFSRNRASMSYLFSKLRFCRGMTFKRSAKHYHSGLQNGGDLDPENELEKLESSSDISSQECENKKWSDFVFWQKKWKTKGSN